MVNDGNDASVLRGTSSSTRTLTARDLAAMRPDRTGARQRRPAERAREASAAVRGVVCLCGRPFGEDEAVEFMLHLRAEVGADLRLLAKVRQWRRRTVSRPEYRERRNAAGRKKRAEAAASRPAREPRPGPVAAPCACGCGEMTAGRGRYKAGHHMRVPGRSPQRQPGSSGRPEMALFLLNLHGPLTAPRMTALAGDGAPVREWSGVLQRLERNGLVRRDGKERTGARAVAVRWATTAATSPTGS